MLAQTMAPVNPPTHPASGPALLFPQDLSTWTGRGTILRAVQASAARACGNSWLDLVRTDVQLTVPDDLLILTAYCYLQAVYHSIDVVRRLDQDEELAGLRPRLVVQPEQVRRFRREHRRSLTDCLTHTLVSLWKERNPLLPGGPIPGGLMHNRIEFSFLEPFYLQAQDRIDRAVVFDSMALDE